MDAICLASLAWVGQREKSETLLSRVAASNPPLPRTLHLDLTAVLREDAACAPLANAAVIPFAGWIKDGLTEDGVLDIETIRKAPHAFPAGGVVVLDAAGFKSEIVVAALHQARQALYPVPHWPAVFVLVIDDAQMFQVSPILASTFQLQPNVQPTTAIKREARQFMQYVRLLRLFGRNIGVAARTLRWFTDRGNRLRERRINRGLGWTWEE